MTKSSVDRKLSVYGRKYNLRFHIKEKKYHLTMMGGQPMLLAVFNENDRDMALRLWELLEKQFLENQGLKSHTKLLDLVRWELEHEDKITYEKFKEMNEYCYKEFKKEFLE